jgi:demethylmenaquinone methyltransferase / 2-methoxy-6-polyprenyl-1,4-benzoquinol methylase
MAARQGAGAPQGGAGLAHGGEGRLEARQVRAMFDRISGVYDLLNTAMTAGLHHRWRERAADLAAIGPGSRVLDVATGTGDLALELARRVGPTGEVIGSDFAEGMLDRARAKARAPAPSAARPRFEWGDAMELPYEDGSFDAATVGFGARNFEDLGLGLSEMARVVRPGGRVVVLEITTPTRAPLSLFYRIWFDRLVPALGSATGKLEARRARGQPSGEVTISDAYTYLPNSVKRFPDPLALAGELDRAGLSDISYVLIAGGIVAIHTGTVTGDR